MIVESLVQLGLTEKEAKMYLMLLRIGPSPVSSLAQRVGMKRVTAYSVLDSLVERGLVTFEQNGSCRRCIPHDPECLLYGLERQSAELKFRKGLAKTCIEGLQRSVNDEALSERKIGFFRGVRTIMGTLKERVEEGATLFVVSLNFGTSILAANCLRRFLGRACKDLQKIHLCVPLGQGTNAGALFPGVKIQEVNFASGAINAELLVQGDRVFFLFSNKEDVQMMCVNDSVYAEFFRKVLLAPYFSTKHRPYVD